VASAVLHDLVMRQPLFLESSQPYARLVNAVQFESPEIQNSAVPRHLVELARGCLLKPWRTRLRLINWGSFSPRDEDLTGHSKKQAVTNRAIISRATLTATGPQADPTAHENLKRETMAFLMASARTIRSENSILPPLKVLAKTPNESAFGIQFRRAAESALKNDLTIFVHLEVVDGPARLIAMTSCGCIGEYSRQEHHPAPSLIFQGTHDGQSLYTALENCIYDLVDQAQVANDATNKMHWILPLGGH
jgi:eukaryotic-like serine/threonine-protein kinase